MVWRNKFFGDCAELARDIVQPGNAQGMPYIGLEHISQGHLSLLGFGKSEDVISAKSRFRRGDILFGKLRPYFRKVILAPFDGVCSTDIWVVRAKPGVVQRFLFYWMASDEFIETSNRASEGTKMPRAQWEYVERIQQEIPGETEQRAIAEVLGSLDDKIELNRRMNATLEALAAALFKHWFVENEEAKGWEVVPLPDIIEVNPSRLLKKGDVAPYLDMANMPMQGHRAIHWIERSFGSGTKFLNGDTLLARITPCLEHGKTAFVDFLSNGQTGWGSTEYIILRPKLPLPPEYGYYLARSDNVRSHAIQNMTGTSGRQRTPASCFDTFEIPVPPSELAMQFGDFAKSVMEKIKANDEQSRTLTELRDALLPRLMRGEILIGDSLDELPATLPSN
jgi:type I restriction enzyme S subunit